MNKTGDWWWIGIFLIRLTSTGHLKWSEACCRHKSRYLIPSCIKLPWRMWAGRQEETRKKGRKEWRLFKHFSSDKKQYCEIEKNQTGPIKYANMNQGCINTEARREGRRGLTLDEWKNIQFYSKLDDKIHILYVPVVKRLCIKTELKHDRNWE